jgi:hypothetical protein
MKECALAPFAAPPPWPFPSMARLCEHMQRLSRAELEKVRALLVTELGGPCPFIEDHKGATRGARFVPMNGQS